MEFISLEGTLDCTVAVIRLYDEVVGHQGELICIDCQNGLRTCASNFYTIITSLPQVDGEDISDGLGRVSIDMRYNDRGRSCLALLDNQTGFQLRIPFVDCSEHGKRTEGLCEETY